MKGKAAEVKKVDEEGLDRLVKIMERLRGPGGCPWDREQTMESLIPFILEEAYEVVDAIESGSADDVKEELGDLLFQVIFASQIAKEKGSFDIYDVIGESSEKMIRRHPHVFGDLEAETTEDVLKHWAEIKKSEGKEKRGYLSGVPEAIPALLRAHKVSEKASKAGFDWKDVDAVIDKVYEELKEFENALSSGDAERTEEELGDLFFALANVSRFIEVNPEEALRKTIGRFIGRFHYIEKKLEEGGKELGSVGLEEMEAMWNEAKAREKKQAITEG